MNSVSRKRRRDGPNRIYVVSVYGYCDQRYSARSAGEARVRAWRQFNEVYSKTFHEFLVISRVRTQRVP